jgi:NADH-quinone oxidoreductase subunit N
MSALPDVMPALPEILLAIIAMAFLLLGAFRGDGHTVVISYLVALAMVVAGVLVVLADGHTATTFNGLFVVDRFAQFMKVLVLLSAALSVLMAVPYIQREQMSRFEFPVLMLLATVGMMMMISANDLIALYLGLETQNLALYVVTAFKRDLARSSEAGLKYFVLSSLSSGILLYGASLVYGFAGTTGFTALATLLLGGQASVGLIIGMVFVAAGLAFKISAVPFHMWTPDVYEGAPTPVTAFLAVASKVAALALFVRLLVGPFGHLVVAWQQIIWVISVASMALGSFAAINQTSIKRLMAYSSIGHIGYALVGLAAGSEQGVQSVLIYMAIYLFMNVGTFAVILCMRQQGRMVEKIADLTGLARTNPLLAVAAAIFMFSMAGIPPLAGFFAKLYVFLAAIEAKLYVLAVIGVVTSVVGAYYYVRIVKLMYFDEPSEALDRPLGRTMSLLLAGASIFTLLFFLFAAPIINGASAAAASLFAG